MKKSVLVLIMLIASAMFAWAQIDPGHSAEQIGAGTIAGALTITDGGQVGIGIDPGNYKLRIKGGNDISDREVRIDSDQISEITVYSDGQFISGNTASAGMTLWVQNGVAPTSRIRAQKINGELAELQIQHNEDSPIRFLNGNDELMRLDFDGKVGIGTEAPQQILQVHKESDENSYARFTNMDSGSAVNDGFDVGYTFNDFAVLMNRENTDLRLGTNNQYRLIINGSSGNVGIGTTIPSESLDVVGNVKATSFIGDGSQLSNVGGKFSDVDGTEGDISYVNGNVGIGIATPNAKLHVERNVGNSVPIMILNNTNTGGGSGTKLRLASHDAGGSVYSYPSNYAAPWIADSFGLVSNSGHLDLYAFTGDIRFLADNPTEGPKMMMTHDGKVGIGTTNPLLALHIENNVPAIRLTDKDDNSDVQIGAYQGGQLILDADINNEQEGSAISFRIDGPGSEKMRIDSVGNVIATGTICDVNGCIGSGGSGKWSTGATGGHIVYVDGNVGIGTTLPGAKLDVEHDNTESYALLRLGTAATVANAQRAVAIGNGAKATKDDSVAIGVGAEANGARATAIGYYTKANEDYSTALGRGINVNGVNSVGIGLSGTSSTITDSGVMAIMGGNVGIGTASPQEKLDVKGNLMIGTGTGDSELVINGSGAGSVKIVRSGTSATNSAMDFYTQFNTLEKRMTITGQGDVGIGEITPSSRLHVRKDGLAPGSNNLISIEGRFNKEFMDSNDKLTIGFEIQSAASAYNLNAIEFTGQGNLILQDNGIGEVGIGTSTPSEKLEVDGNIKATGTIKADGGLILPTIEQGSPMPTEEGAIWIEVPGPR
jgi:hypothetical protein